MEDIDPIKKRLLKNAKWRAKKLGLAFLIGPNHFVLPTHCPVLGILLRPNLGHTTGDDQSPSLDRIIPAFGYIPGNVIVVSYRANRLKAQSTPSEIRLVADFYTRLELHLYRNKP